MILDLSYIPPSAKLLEQERSREAAKCLLARLPLRFERHRYSPALGLISFFAACWRHSNRPALLPML